MLSSGSTCIRQVWKIESEALYKCMRGVLQTSSIGKGKEDMCKLLKQCRTFSIHFTHALTIVSFPRLTVVHQYKVKIGQWNEGKNQINTGFGEYIYFPIFWKPHRTFPMVLWAPVFCGCSVFPSLHISYLWLQLIWFHLDADTHPHNQWLPFINT